MKDQTARSLQSDLDLHSPQKVSGSGSARLGLPTKGVIYLIDATK